MSRLKCACAIMFLKLTICNSFTVDIFDWSRLDANGKPALKETVGDNSDFKKEIIRVPTGRRTAEIRSTNIFEDFVIAMLDLLSGYPGRMLTRYCRVVYREVDRLDYKYTRKLAKHFQELSRMDRDEIRDEMRQYKQEMLTKTKQLKAFIDDMNEVFTMEEGIKFSDYIYDVRDYGNLMKRDVKEETRALLNSIVKAVKKLSTRDQTKLEQKMRRAVREHNNLGSTELLAQLGFSS